MFTGIVLTLARVAEVAFSGHDARLVINAPCPLPNLTLGESIAVNGVCLTVEGGHSAAASSFSAFASAETLRCTTLGQLRRGDAVNIERALALGDRLGGHVVSGHVDTVAEVESVVLVGQSRRVRVCVPARLAPEILPKGSVTLDGVSLTINTCGLDVLEVNVIPETWRVTTIAHWQAGRAINLETDVLGKYVRHNLVLAGLVPAAARQGDSPASARVTEAFLRDNGFL